MVPPVVGVTGAMMSFEAPIMEALSAGIMRVPARAEAALTPDALLARFATQAPDATPTLLIMKTQPGAAPDVPARVHRRQTGRAGQELPRSYLDPYTGRMLGKANGEVFFDDVQRLHRFLLLDGGSSEAGKRITAAAAFAMVFFVLSGLYLRWPRRALDWKVKENARRFAFKIMPSARSSTTNLSPSATPRKPGSSTGRRTAALSPPLLNAQFHIAPKGNTLFL